MVLRRERRDVRPAATGTSTAGAEHDGAEEDGAADSDPSESDRCRVTTGSPAPSRWSAGSSPSDEEESSSSATCGGT